MSHFPRPIARDRLRAREKPSTSGELVKGNDPDRTWIMPKVTARTVVLTALLALTLTGCAGNVGDTPSEADRPAAATSGQEPEASPAPTPLTEQETWFVDKETWESFGLTDAELLDAAALACEEFAAGKTGDTMTLPGIPEDLTRYFANSARAEFCPA